jgi:ADP-ribose pyrophosphatase
MSFEIIGTKKVYEGRVFNVRLDQIRLPNRRLIQADIIEHHNSVAIIPVDYDGNVWFVRQYRYPAEKNLLELPAGVMDENETPVQSAQRELREETGMAAERLTLLGEFYLAPGYSTEYMHVFLAEDLRPSPLSPNVDEFIDLEKISYDQILHMINNGDIYDAKSLAALFLWNMKA